MIRRNISLLLAAVAAVALVVTGSGAGNAAGNAQPEHRGFAPGRLLVGLEDASASPSAASARLQSTLRGHNAAAVRAIGKSRTHVVTTPPGRELAIARALSRDPAVEFAEPDYTVTAADVPDDERFDELWGLHNDDGNIGTPDADIDAPEAWDVTTGTSTVVVAVLDTGVDYTHPDLAANIWTNPGEIPGNGEDDDGNGWVDDVHGVDTLNDDSDPMDDAGNSHGTHVAGTIGAVGDNGIGVTGVSQRVSIMPLKFLDDEGSGLISGAIAAIDYMRDMKARGVNVVVANNSWTSDGVSQSLRDAISGAADDGIFFTAAAGNSGVDIEESPKSPASIDLPNIIGVAASGPNDGRPGFSNWGSSSVDLAAPGHGILSTSIGGGYHALSGTSMATPHVSGAAALLWAQDPGRSYSEVRNLLLSSVDRLGAWESLVRTGGRLNAHASLLAGDGSLHILPLSPDAGGEHLACDSVPISAEVLAGADPAVGATVTASFANGDADLALLDDGAGPDGTADDGVYTASHSWGAAGDGTITIEASHDDSSEPALRDIPGEVLPLTEPLFPFAVARDGAATMDWEPPRRDCGDPPHEYVLTSDPPSPESPMVVSGSSTTVAMSGLENGVEYTFTVQARNGLGTGKPSAPSNPVMPQSPPAPGASPSSYELELAPGTSTTRNLTIGNSGEGPLAYRLHTAPPVSGSAADASAESVDGVEALARDLFAAQEPGVLTHVTSATSQVSQHSLPDDFARFPGQALAASDDRLFYFDGSRDDAVHVLTHDGDLQGAVPVDLDTLGLGELQRAGLAFSDGVLYLALTDFVQDYLITLDPDSGEVVDSVELGFFVGGGLAPGPEGTLYATVDLFPNPGARVIQIDAGTGAETRSVAISDKEHTGLAYDGTHLVASTPFQDAHDVLDPASGEVVNGISGLPPLSALAVPPSAPWITLGSASGTLPPGGTADIGVTFDSAGLKTGAHDARLVVEHNDPDSGPLSIPVNLSVLPDVTIEAPDVRVAPGGSAQADIFIRGVQEGAGLGSYDLQLSWDPSVAVVSDVQGGDPPFDSPPTVEIDNEAGTAAFRGDHSEPTGPSGDVRVASVSLSAVCEEAGPGFALNISVGDGGVATAESEPLTTAVVDGSVTCVPPLSAAPDMRYHRDSEDYSGGAEWDGPGDKAAGVLLDVSEVTDLNGDPADVLLSGYTARLDYDPGCMSILGFRGGPGFTMAAPEIDPSSERAIVSASSTAGVSLDSPLAFALTRLTGSAEQTCVLEMSLTSLTTTGGVSATSTDTSRVELQRGNIRQDEDANIADALFGAQYLAGLRAGCVSPKRPGEPGDTTCAEVAGMASVRHDDGFDVPNIADVLFIAQRLAGLRDDSFNTR